MSTEHFDVIIVGAGLSGIGAAWHLQDQCPGKSYTILEGRDTMGGTWDLFRYPGIRSDSDMHTLGYSFKPWVEAKAIADGPSILNYIRETAAENGIDQHIRYRHQVDSAAWSSDEAAWTLETRNEATGESRQLSCNFLLMCCGYYSYKHPHDPEFPGRERFRGQIIHPQFWPENCDYQGKKVVIIGSGATAVTLLPELAKQAASAIMLQRSPTYMASAPARDAIANFLRKILPGKWAYAITRFKNVRMQQWLYRKSRTDPELLKAKLLHRVRKALGPDYDVDTHFTPSYNPWDERLCLVPDNDLFDAIRSGAASVVTGHIESFTETGIALTSGETLDADIIITATGLSMEIMGGMQLQVDGEDVDYSKTWTYKGLMTTGVPNLVNTFGYINASWTLRADITAEWVCRLLNHMDATGARQVVPALRPGDADMPARPWVEEFTPGYMQRMMHAFPRQGDREPWINPQDYKRDKKMFRQGPLDDGALLFSSPGDNAGAVETGEPELREAS
jgi:cation diffusion facilitator CzcD-associated flavoprotein CzcO